MKDIQLLSQEGEGQHIEFKEGVARLDREMVAFANACGGSIFIGISDDGRILGTDTSNRRLAALQDIARNCDPSIDLDFLRHPGNVLEIVVAEGNDKPYRCKEGFFLRVGPSAQKLRRDEIATLILSQGRFHYDELDNNQFSFPADFSSRRLAGFMASCNVATDASAEAVLLSLDCARMVEGSIRINNAGAFFFALDPQRFLRESYITCVRYGGVDRTSIIDRKDFMGDPIALIEDGIAFVMRHTSRGQVVSGRSARREDVFDYPYVAVREAIVNAVMHRDYYNDSSHVYVHVFSDRLEIENPGGLPGGLSLEELGERSVRRNRTIADLLYRAGYAERVGSGIQRIRKALAENGNPPMTMVSTNYFVVRFFPRPLIAGERTLTPRQAALVGLMEEMGSISTSEGAQRIGASGDTVLRELRGLLSAGIVVRQGTGRSARYSVRM